MEKYRRSRKWLFYIVLSSFFLSSLFSFLSIEVRFPHSNDFLSCLHGDVEGIGRSVASKKLNVRVIETCIYDITKNAIKHPIVKRGKIEDWRLFFGMVLHIIAVLPVVSAKRYYYKKIFLWHQWELIHYIQDKDGKKRQFIEKQIRIAV